jgi:coenzyme F420-0:L-glutamate ligase/coenzyme F420-1:gamma-L-glutamate ligase
MTIAIIPLTGIPEIRRGDDIATSILEAAASAHLALIDDDIVVVTHKVVSKAEGATAELSESDHEAYRSLVESEAVEVIRRRGDLIIAKTRHGFICANAGVDRSNAAPGTVVLLPRDPDRSAHAIRRSLEEATGARLAVVVTDTFGRPWRRGLVDVAIGVSGLDPVLDLRGTTDTHGRELAVTEVALADEVAAAADLAMGKADGIPVAVVRGLQLAGEGRAADLIRPAGEDLFR